MPPFDATLGTFLERQGTNYLMPVSSTDTNMDSHGCEGNEQSATTSGRQHGTRWFNVVQGIRRSLDVHLKSYCKASEKGR